MSEDALRREVEALRRKLAEAEQTIFALASGEIDSVADPVEGSPVLLRAAQESLRKSEQVLRAIFTSAHDAMTLADDNGVFVDVNPAALVLTGRTREQLIGQGIAGILEPGCDFPGAWRAFLDNGRSSGTVTVVRTDGSRREAEFSAVAHIVAGLHLSVLRDVTDRKRAEELRSHLAAIVESSDDAIMSLDLDGVVLSWNRGAKRLYQYDASEMVGRSLTVLVPPGYDDREAIFARVGQGHSVEHVETRRLRKDGTLVDVSLTSSPILDATGNVVGMSRIARDLTERRKAEAVLQQTEEQLRQAQKMEAIGRLAGGVAHDFNNLLSVVLTYSRLTLDTLAPGDPIREDLLEIAAAGERAALLTRQLLAFSRKQILQPQLVDLDQIVRGMERMLGRLLGEDVELSLHSNPVGTAYVDPGQIEQILMNLVVNARDAMTHGGELTIETANVTLDQNYAVGHHGVIPGDYVMLAVTDTGVGMNAATRARIFEPFFTTKGPGKGTGLGLSTVFGIVQQSGGHIWVHSEPGVGTTFKVYFPRADPTAVGASSTVPPDARALMGRETVLLAEDEDPVRRSVRRVLQKQGYNVLEARNGGEALLLCEKFQAKIHLLLTDVVMPHMNGRELAARLCKLRPEMKVLYVSGYTEDAIVHHGVLDAGIAFLQKPLTPSALLRKVRQILDR